MPMHPNSLANLGPAWEPGVQPKPGPRYVEKMLERGNKLAPQAIAILGRVMKDPETPIGLVVRTAEFIVDKNWPKAASGGAGVGLSLEGVDFLELRFTAPSGPENGLKTTPEALRSNGNATTLTITLDAEGK